MRKGDGGRVLLLEGKTWSMVEARSRRDRAATAKSQMERWLPTAIFWLVDWLLSDLCRHFVVSR